MFEIGRCKSQNLLLLRFGTRLAPVCMREFWRERMLKISIVDGANRRRLVVEGKLIGPWAAELKSACEVARAGMPAGGLLVDMNQVTAISQEGESVLLDLMKEGVKFRCCGVFTKHVLKQIARRARGNFSRARG